MLFRSIAAQGAIDLQAQSGAAQVAAKQTLEMKTAHGVVNIVAAKRIVLQTTGGASVTIAAEGLSFECPGKILVNAGMKSFGGAESYATALNGWPKTSFDDAFIVRHAATGEPMANTEVELLRADGTTIRLTTDASGALPKQASQFVEGITIRAV